MANPKLKQLTISLISPKLLIYISAACVFLFIIFQIGSLKTRFSSPSDSESPSTSWSLFNHYQCADAQLDLQETMTEEKLRDSVTFLPLKDLRYTGTPQQGHTWFMSSMNDTQVEGEVQHQQFPSNSSKGRVLCLMGRDTHDGARNGYALAWPDALPYNATLMKGLTFVSYNHYNYENIWHGLSTLFPFIGWHEKNNCAKPDRWILYHWGELRFKMNTWLSTLLEATVGGPINIEKFDDIKGDDVPVCFEKAVVMRHNEGGMSKARRIEAFDLMRCKARDYCNVSEGRAGAPEIGMTMLMRTGPRSFKNDSVVVGIFDRECAKVDGCKLMVAYSNNLTFCDQVKLMSMTDILISSHGAQLTNLFLMDKNSSVMEFFPKGWLKLAGAGQFVFHGLSSWSGMIHQGEWRDPDGDTCPYLNDDRRCMSMYKGGRIGYNETFFAQWATSVIKEVKERKMREQVLDKSNGSHYGCVC